ncbi:MAG: hypothetical protein FI707_17600 [SAR202 cluster bacterium]|jgi:hypothetical protein|nr:hypothetical protein [Chloroflexota bacterium]MDP6423042.1 hypothetical protein [SAR202 cluster bacterium]HAL48392.1 hypothetical protein [Dehalococcoidia bacterium]MDP6663601.1 hypothetical protein [SAR202 cluster bacterium]MDP6800264.1 hypothetical protein [SAR202 cluster bacterium]
MTNTMHRQGTVESLRQDYIIFSTTAKGFNRKGSGEAQRRFIEIMMKHRPVNMGLTRHVADAEKKPSFIAEAFRNRFFGRKYRDGQPTDETRQDWERVLQEGGDSGSLKSHAVFDSADKLGAAIRDVNDAGLGLCVNVNAIHEDTDRLARESGIVRHTIEHSLGFHGRTERLPSSEIMELSTMCGHGMVSFNLVRKMISMVGSGQISTDRAAELLTKPCACGVFNPARAARILSDIQQGTYATRSG